MFRSLLQTIPTVSGNFTLACKLNNYSKINNHQYISYINDAILMPLDNKFNLTKDVKINLINGKYEFDILKYFKEMSSNFYNDEYLENNNIFETYLTENIYNLPDNRDKNFEFGCKRIPYNKYQYQYQFYAPIYINSIDDLPDYFTIEIYHNDYIVKKIQIPISINDSQNKLRIYLSKFIQKLQNNTPINWDFNNNRTIYNNVIDCKNGGLISVISYNIINSKKIYQTVINEIDNLICQNYKQHNIILSECIPLSFIFDLNDLLDNSDNYYYNFNQFTIIGYYSKNNVKCNFYTFETNYHDNYTSIEKFDNITNKFHKINYNIFDNNVSYTLHEKTNYNLYYTNSYKNKYFQWKLIDSDNYIININTAFTNNKNKFPVFKNSIKSNILGIFDNNTLYLPINNFINVYNSYEQEQYNLLINNNYNNWFTIYNNQIDINDFKPVYNNYVFTNGIRYYIQDNSIKYFNIYLNPILEEYDPNLLVGDVILEKTKNDDDLYDINYLEENNQYYTKYDMSLLNDLSDDDEIYIKYDNQIKYIDYNENIININNNQYSIVQDNIDLYKELFDRYFIPHYGYEKLNISLDLYNELKINHIFDDNRELRKKIYYSLPNSKEKRNLYNDIYQKNIEYNDLLKYNISLFIKKIFLEINNEFKFNKNIFGENGLYTNIILSQYYINNTNKNIKLFIENIKLYIKQNNINSLLNDYYQIKDNINTINLKNITSLILYVLLYQEVNKYYSNNKSSLISYKYIPYYNDNNIVINYDYYEKLFNNDNYYNLYSNIKASNISIKSKINVKITDLDVLNYYIKNDLIFKYFHKEIIIDEFNQSFQLINLSTYIKDYIVNHILKDNNIISDNMTINNKSISRYISNNTDDSQLLNILKHAIKINNLHELYIELIYIDGEHTIVYKIPINLYIQIYAYKLYGDIDSYKFSKEEPLIIYKEIAENSIDSRKIFNIIYNDFSSNKKENLSYQILIKNIQKINNLYVYKNPYNYLIKTNIKSYLNDYVDDQPQIYIKANNINTLNIEYIDKSKDSSLSDNMSYILINYHIMMSTNLFNLYNIDNNDNLEIKQINNITINKTSIKDTFKYLYPYLKQDILLNSISAINNLTNINLLLPNNIKCYINKESYLMPDNQLFTQIKTRQNNIDIIYLNRYFGSIDPYFKEVNQYLNNKRSKIYYIIDNYNNIQQQSNHNNIYIEHINLYNYNYIPYYNHKNNILQFHSQIEYKHFNDNYLFNLPHELHIQTLDIDYVDDEQLSIYINSDKCFEYFKQYLKNNYINYNLVTDENLFLYIFSRYNIEYIQYPELNNVLKKVYKITYKLTLI